VDNGILAGLALVLGATVVGLANLKMHAWKARKRRANPRPLALSSLATGEIKYYPGVPGGYVGYTDYTAMNVELNDGLIGRPADEQFMLVGFGHGFSTVMLERVATDELSGKCAFRIAAASEEDMQCLGWLALMQDRGTDNAPPSTRNLQRVISKVSRELAEGGPITMKFWHKVHSKRSETLQASGTSPAELDSLRQTLDLQRLRGARLALEAALLSGKD
jgi:hypothetical protein